MNITTYPNGSALDLPSGGRYVISLRVRNPLGLTALGVSQAFVVDYSAPTRGSAEVGAFALPLGFQGQARFADGVVTGSTVSVIFKGWGDAESSLSSLRVALYMLSHMSAVVPWTSGAIASDRVVTDAATIRDRCRAPASAPTATLLAAWTPVDVTGE